MRPYALLTNTRDNRHLPGAEHRRASRLLRLLGSSFDPVWTSIEKPPGASGSHSGGHVPLHTDQRLKKAAALGQQQLEEEAGALDLGPLPPQLAGTLGAWLVHLSTCGLRHRWAAVGPAFWPRWLIVKGQAEGTVAPFLVGWSAYVHRQRTLRSWLGTVWEPEN